MAGYNGPATIVSRWGEIEVTVDLRAATDTDGWRNWSGHLDRCDREKLRRAMDGMSLQGLIIRFPSGDEGNFMPSPETTWSPCSVSVCGFMRSAGPSRPAAPSDVATATQLPHPRRPDEDQRRDFPQDLTPSAVETRSSTWITGSGQGTSFPRH